MTYFRAEHVTHILLNIAEVYGYSKFTDTDAAASHQYGVDFAVSQIALGLAELERHALPDAPLGEGDDGKVVITQDEYTSLKGDAMTLAKLLESNEVVTAKSNVTIEIDDSDYAQGMSDVSVDPVVHAGWLNLRAAASALMAQAAFWNNRQLIEQVGVPREVDDLADALKDLKAREDALLKE